MAKLTCLATSDPTAYCRIFDISSEKMMLYMAPFIRLEEENVFVLDQYCWFVSMSFKAKVLDAHAFGFELLFSLL